MRCKRVDNLLPAYLDGDLPAWLNRRVSDHLEACARCRSELETQRQALRLLEVGRRPVSIDLWADFSRRLQAQPAPRPAAWRFLWQPGLATAVAAVAVALISSSAPAPPSAAPPSARPVQVARLVKPDVTLAAAGGAAVAPAPAPSADALRGRSRGQGPVDPPSGSASRPQPRAHASLRPERAAGTHRSRFGADRSAARSAASPLGVERRTRTGSYRLAASASREHGIGPRKQAGVGTDHGDARREMRLVRNDPDRAAVISSTSDVGAARTRTSRAANHSAHHLTSDPLQVAQALVAVQQDVASEQAQRELLYMAREVVRMGGEAAPADLSPAPMPGNNAAETSAPDAPDTQGKPSP